MRTMMLSVYIPKRIKKQVNKMTLILQFFQAFFCCYKMSYTLSLGRSINHAHREVILRQTWYDIIKEGYDCDLERKKHMQSGKSEWVREK